MTKPKLAEAWYLSTDAPYYVFHATRCQLYCRFDTDNMVFASTMV